MLVLSEKRNKRQFLFNGNMKTRQTLLKSTWNWWSQQTRYKGSTVESKVEARKKFNLLAACQEDRSQYGWALVLKYEDKELASNEDDVKREKKLRRQWLQRHK